MPSVSNKAYNSLLEVINELIKGAVKHTSNPRIATNLNGSELEAPKSGPGISSAGLFASGMEARKAYERLKLKFNSAQKKVSNDCRIIKGILDPRAEELLDFGIVPEKSKSPKNRIINIENLKVRNS